MSSVHCRVGVPNRSPQAAVFFKPAIGTGHQTSFGSKYLLSDGSKLLIGSLHHRNQVIVSSAFHSESLSSGRRDDDWWFQLLGVVTEYVFATKEQYQQRQRIEVIRKSDGKAVTLNINNWLIRQKQSHKKGEMPKERIAAFERLLADIETQVRSWRPRPVPEHFEYLWEEHFDNIQQFVKVHKRLPKDDDTVLFTGTAISSNGDKRGGYNVYYYNAINFRIWVNFQRHKQRNGKLTMEKQLKLESLHYMTDDGDTVYVWSWHPAQDTQETNCSAVEKIVETTGELPKWNDSQKLYRWVLRLAEKQLDSPRLAPGVKDRLLALPPFVALMNKFRQR